MTRGVRLNLGEQDGSVCPQLFKYANTTILSWLDIQLLCIGIKVTKLLSVKPLKRGFKLSFLVLTFIATGCVTPEMKIAHNQTLMNDLSCVTSFCYDLASKNGLNGASTAMHDFAPHCMFSHIALHQSASKNLGLFPQNVSAYINEYDNQRVTACRQSAQKGVEVFCEILADKEKTLRNKQKGLKGRNADRSEIRRIALELAEVESDIDFNCK